MAFVPQKAPDRDHLAADVALWDSVAGYALLPDQATVFVFDALMQPVECDAFNGFHARLPISFKY